MENSRVYLVFEDYKYDEYFQPNICGVFSSVKLAQTWVDDRQTKGSPNCTYEIEEYTIDDNFASN